MQLIPKRIAAKYSVSSRESRGAIYSALLLEQLNNLINAEFAPEA